MIFITLVAVIVIIIIIFVALWIKTSNSENDSAELAGEVGESIISRQLGENVEGVQYIINNALFRDKYKNTCQIDHILINENGIWVIETKNFSGRVYGTKEQRYWTQVKSYGENKKTFHNPIIQNEGHIKKLKTRIKFGCQVHNVVVFVDTDLSEINIENVCDIYELKNKTRQSVGKPISSDEMRKYYNLICKMIENDQVTIEEHIENVNKIKESIRNDRCPYCGVKLVKRKGQHGEFYGCANYPSCHFKINSLEEKDRL